MEVNLYPPVICKILYLPAVTLWIYPTAKVSKGRFSQSWGLRASVSFSCLPSPSPLLLSVLHSPQLLRRQKAKKRLERAQNPTETLATQPSYKYSQRICAFISKFYLVISILYMQHTNETSKQKKTSKTAASNLHKHHFSEISANSCFVFWLSGPSLRAIVDFLFVEAFNSNNLLSEAVVGLNLFYPKSFRKQFCAFLKAPEFKHFAVSKLML